MPAPDRYSFIFDCSSQALDHVFITDVLASLGKVDHALVNVDSPWTSTNTVGSDHEPILIELKLAGKKDVK